MTKIKRTTILRDSNNTDTRLVPVATASYWDYIRMQRKNYWTVSKEFYVDFFLTGYTFFLRLLLLPLLILQNITGNWLFSIVWIFDKRKYEKQAIEEYGSVEGLNTKAEELEKNVSNNQD